MVRDTVTHLLIGEDVVQNATGIADVDAGEIIVINANGGAILNAAAITALGDNDPFYIVQGKKAGNDAHVISPRLTKGSIVAHRGTSYAAAVQQVTFVGSDGVAGDITPVSSTEYIMSVSFEQDKSIYSERKDVKTYAYTSDATATSLEIATALAALMNADASFASQAVAAVTTQATNSGISITGIAQSTSELYNPELVSFTVALGAGFDASTRLDERGYVYLNNATPTTTGSTSVSPTPGVGTYAKVQALEQGTLGYTTGRSNFRKFPIVKESASVSASGTYDVYVIDYSDTHSNSEIGVDAKRTTQGQIIVANNIATTVNGSTAAIEALFLVITGTTVSL